MSPNPRWLPWLSLCVALAFAAPPAEAQSCTATGRGAGSCTVVGLGISIAVGRATHLTVSAVSTPLTTPSASHYDAGFAATAGPTLTVRSNAPWSLAISAVSATWQAADTQSEPARPDKPAGDLLWGTSSAGPFTPLGTAPVTVASGLGATAGSSLSLHYRTLYAYGSDAPGAYALQIVFTITTP